MMSFWAEHTWNNSEDVQLICHRQSHTQFMNLWEEANSNFIYVGCDSGWVQWNYMQ